MGVGVGGSGGALPVFGALVDDSWKKGKERRHISQGVGEKPTLSLGTFASTLTISLSDKSTVLIAALQEDKPVVAWKEFCSYYRASSLRELPTLC